VSRSRTAVDPPAPTPERPARPEAETALDGTSLERTTAAVDSAADRIRETLPGREDLDIPEGTTAESLLDSVRGDLIARLSQKVTHHLRDPAEAPARLRLLQLLQSEIIHVWTRLSPEPPERDEILRVFGELDRMMVSLEPHGRDRLVALMESQSPLTMVVQLAHDLRSPLTSILFLSELLQRGRSGPVTDTQQRQLGVIYSAAFALVAVANDVIELARGGGVNLTEEEPVPFSLAECLGRIREMLLPMAEDKGVELRVVTPREDRRVGRPSAISRALLNLATNALKFTQEGFVEIAAEASGWEDIRFAVTDSGRGMTPEAERNLFQPFQKSERRKGVYFSGSGLGLSIVRRIVDDLGGALDYETRMGHGTRFEFTLRLPSALDLRG